ncbi:hypothetical protein JCM1393_19770 [Clostridium carnis]
MKGKFINISIFVLSVLCLVISLKTFWNMGIYVDEFNTSPDIVLGGNFWLYMNWLKLVCSALICILSCINLFHKKK